MTDEFSDPEQYAMLERVLTQDEYSMNLSREVADFLGKPTADYAVTNIFPGRCLTCTDPIVSQMDISADFDANIGVLMSAHHATCRPSSLNEHGHTMSVGTPAVILGSVGDSHNGLPLMVVNPGLETLLLAPSRQAPYRIPTKRARRRAWTNLSVQEFAAHGLVPGRPAPPPVARDITASRTDETLTVQIERHTWRPHEWTVRIPNAVAPLLDALGGFGLAVLTKTIPQRLGLEDLPKAFNDSDARIGWVRL